MQQYVVESYSATLSVEIDPTDVRATEECSIEAETQICLAGSSRIRDEGRRDLLVVSRLARGRREQRDTDAEIRRPYPSVPDSLRAAVIPGGSRRCLPRTCVVEISLLLMTVTRQSKRLPIASLRELLAASAAFNPTKRAEFKGTAEEEAAVHAALLVLSRAVFDRLIFVPYLSELRKDLTTLKEACAQTSGALQSLLMTRDQGMRGMEEVAGSLLPDDDFATPFEHLQLYLRPNSASEFLRKLDPTFPPQLRETIDRLLTQVDDRLSACGEPRGKRPRGRPPEHPAIIEATRLLSDAGLTPSRIQKALGTEIAIVRDNTRRTRNGKGYQGPRDLRRTLRRHRGKKSA